MTFCYPPEGINLQVSVVMTTVLFTYVVSCTLACDNRSVIYGCYNDCCNILLSSLDEVSS